MSSVNAERINMESHRGEKANTMKKAKAEALKRRMGELQLGEMDVATQCGFTSRDVVSRWRAGSSWPYPAGEEKLEDVLAVPRGFFARIVAGSSYEDALIVTETKSDDAEFTLLLTEALMTLQPFKEGKVYKVGEIRDHLKRQIQLFSMVFPDTPVTPEGLRRLRIALEKDNANYRIEVTPYREKKDS